MGAISKMMFLFGSDRLTLLTNIAGVPLKIPSESNVMLYQLTSPVEVHSQLAAGVAGVELFGSIWLITVVQVEEDARLAGRRIDAINHARPVDGAVVGVVAGPREIA